MTSKPGAQLVQHIPHSLGHQKIGGIRRQCAPRQQIEILDGSRLDALFDLDLSGEHVGKPFLVAPMQQMMAAPFAQVGIDK
jgi:hypothetical protein